MEINCLKDLKGSLEQFLNEQGLSQNFNNNPAFKEILNKLKSMEKQLVFLYVTLKKQKKEILY